MRKEGMWRDKKRKRNNIEFRKNINNRKQGKQVRTISKEEEKKTKNKNKKS